MKDEETKKVWSLGLNPMPDNNEYDVVYGFGYAKYIHKSNGIRTGIRCICAKRGQYKGSNITFKKYYAKQKKIKDLLL